MKQFLAFLLIVAAAIALYQAHIKQVEGAALEATARARADALRLQPKPKELPVIHAVAVSHGLQELYQEVFSNLDRQHPVDLAPPLQMTREHILDAKVRADAGMQPVYELGGRVAAALTDVAEERTKALESLLEAIVRPAASLDGKNSATGTNEFFAQAAPKRWDEERRRRKPNVDALMGALRDAERNWNQHLPKDAPVDSYEAPDYKELLITVDPVVHSNPLERTSYDQRRLKFPWRTTYYDQNGYRRTY